MNRLSVAVMRVAEEKQTAANWRAVNKYYKLGKQAYFTWADRMLQEVVL